MPKVIDTRKQRAIELLDKVSNGPAYFVDAFANNSDKTEIVARQNYKRWSESWIIYELIDLIPELKKEQKKLFEAKKKPPR